MKEPIIIIAEDIDVEFYETVVDAESNMEPIDVQNAIYKAYDSMGKLLQISVRKETEKKPWYLGGGYNHIEYVSITDRSPEKDDKKELELSLINYYKYLSSQSPTKFPIHIHSQMELKELIDLAICYHLLRERN